MLYEELKDYFVPDLVCEDAKIIFILESPHTDEVKNTYPVAGKSGKDMSQVLFNLDEAFGKLIYEKKIKNIGILNISNYPLQKSAYKDKNFKNLEFFEKIRQNPKLRKKDNPINKVIREMMGDFKSRLEVFKNKKIVLCGNFAQNCFDTVFNEDDFTNILRVPHPSFNNWKKNRYVDKIEELKGYIRC